MDSPPNAVVTLQKVAAKEGNAQQILDIQNKQLVARLKVTDLKTSSATVCGSTAQSTTYTAPGDGQDPGPHRDLAGGGFHRR